MADSQADSHGWGEGGGPNAVSQKLLPTSSCYSSGPDNLPALGIAASSCYSSGSQNQKFPKIAPFELKKIPSESFFRAGEHGDVRFVQIPQKRPFLAGKPLLTTIADNHC